MTRQGASTNGPDGEALETRLARVVSFVERLPEAEAVEHGTHLSLEVRRKRFGWLLNDHHGDGRLAINCKSSGDLRDRLRESMPGAFHVPKHVGHHGWVGLWLDTNRLDWALVEDALVEAYRMTAPKTLTRRLEE